MAKTMKIKMMGVVEANSYGDISVDGCGLRDLIAQQLGLLEQEHEGSERPFQRHRFAGEIFLEISDLSIKPDCISDFVAPDATESMQEDEW